MPTLKGYLALLQHGRYLAKLLLNNAVNEFRDVSAVDEAASISDSEAENVSHMEDCSLIVTDDSDGDDYD